MHRKKLFELLKKYNPVYPEEIIDREKMLDFLDNNVDCFERSLKSGHFTGSSWLVNYENTEFLLTLHKKFDTWLQLGGHADGDSDIVKVSIKEAHEESGLKNIEMLSPEIFDISAHEVAEYKGIPAHFHYDVRFILKASNPNESIQISDESNDLKWFKTPPSDNHEINRMFEKWKNEFS